MNVSWSGDGCSEEVVEFSIISMSIERTAVGAMVGGDEAAIFAPHILDLMNQH